MSMIDDIINWANSELPEWQREAVGLLLTQESLTSEDKERLFVLFKKGNSLPGVDDIETAVVQVLKREEILGTHDVDRTLVLKSVQETKNVNAIPDSSSLPFAHKGLTVIYGENGAGKSGYARILKKACFARDDKEKIHSNIFNTSLIGPAEAVIKLGIDGEDELLKWVDGQQGHDILRNICVFDNKCARVILDEKNTPSYLPYGADVFQKLGALVQEFKSKLEQEKPLPIKPEITDLPAETKAGAFFESLSARTKNKDLSEWFRWDGKDEDSFNKLSAVYAKAKAGDTTKQIRVLGNFKDRLTSFKEKLVEYSELLSSESIENINQLIESRNAFQKAFDIASNKPDGPLAGIATNEWQALYWAAKEYSTKQAYLGEGFPVIGEDKKCVLCMQPLSVDASDRLEKFHEYMESSAKKSLDDTTKKLKVKIENIKSIDLGDFQIGYKDVLSEIEDIDKLIMQDTCDHINKLNNIRELLIKADLDKTKCSEKGVDFDSMKIDKLSEIIDSEIEKCRKNSDPQGLENLRSELVELKAKKQFAINREAISGYLKSLRLEALYDIALSTLNTRSVTDKGSSLISHALTPQLVETLLKELNLLGADYISLNLKHSGRAGQNLHQMKIDGVTELSDIKLTEILSEGEQKVIAIAGFLAELSLQDAPIPIVIDDPVSSLDHKFSEKIAVRIVAESVNRQVIIFTHDISFLLDLQDKSESRGQYCHCVNIRREGDAAGITRGDEPWHAMSVNKRINYIEQELSGIVRADLYQTDKQKYNQQTGVLYGNLRETWEAAIEEYLFYKVVGRHQPDIKTQRLKEVAVERSDCDAIVKEWEKCSKWFIGHSLSRPISDNRPAPHEFQEDIKKLKDFVHTMKAKRKTMGISQKTLIPGIG